MDIAKGPNATKEDKNPKGGLSAKGRKKFGVKAGVKNYSSASRKDKGRWVSWAMRFTGTPKPVKDANGNPTRYALMFSAWGEKVPTSRADVEAVHAKAVRRSKELKKSDAASYEETVEFVDTHIVGCDSCERVFLDDAALWTHIEVVHLNDPTIPLATEESREFNTKQRKQAAAKGQALPGGGFPIKNQQDLKNAIQAFGRAKNKAATKAHIIRRAKALGLTKLLPEGWTMGDKASSGTPLYECPEEHCGRSFRDEAMLFDHAEAVHTFDDIRRMLAEAVREKYGKPSSATQAGTYVWIDDLATDWLVFMIEEPGDSKLMKASYSVTDNQVTLGDPVEVRRRTVYEPVSSD